MNPKTLRFRDGIAGSPRNAVILLRNTFRTGGQTSQALIATLRISALKERTLEELCRTDEKKTLTSLHRLFAEAMDGITSSEELLEKLKQEASEGKSVVTKSIELALSSDINKRTRGIEELIRLRNFKALFYVFIKTDCKATSERALIELGKAQENYQMDELEMAQYTYDVAAKSRDIEEIESALELLANYALLPHKKAIIEEIKKERKVA